MEASIEHALNNDLTIDITTIGRLSGQPRRVEIWFHNIAGRLYITGTPGGRGWYANLVADPRMTFHLKESVQADLEALAHPIVADDQKRPILATITERVAPTADLEAWVSDSPLVEVTLVALEEN